MDKAGADGFASVRRNNGAPTILVTKEVMTSFDAQNDKAGLCECGDEFGSRDARSTAHAAMVTR